MSTRYVQSKWSKDAPIHELAKEQLSDERLYVAKWDGMIYQDDYCYLLKSDYHEVPAPEKWEDVTDACKVFPFNFTDKPELDTALYFFNDGEIVRSNDGYSVEKVEVNFIGKGVEHGCTRGVAFIVKRKVQAKGGTK